MKFLEARKQDGKDAKASILPENKMQQGSRLDQRDPQSLISSPRGSSSDKQDKTDATLVSLAGELGVDLNSVKGSGPKGRITEKDIREAKRSQDQSQHSSIDNK